MPVYKQKNRSGKVRWGYMFSLAGSTRRDRRRVTGSGFATKNDATNAEAQRRIEERQKLELTKRGNEPEQIPKTVAMLLEEFFRQHVEGKLAPKTIERYRQHTAYLHQDLVAMPLSDIRPIHLSREWQRLLKCGGHCRKTKEPRPLSAKTVRHVAGVLSSAFSRAIKWELLSSNPVIGSDPPVPKKHRGVALTPAQRKLMVAAAGGPWYLATFLEVSATTGARRGEVLALRWSDIRDGRAVITRSLTQTKVASSSNAPRPRKVCGR
jgi:integrase